AVLRGGWAVLRRGVRPRLRRLPALVSGTTDALVMMSSFMVVMLVAHRDGAATAAVTAVLVNVVRTLVVPLKQFGIVGGRLAAAADDPGGIDRRLRLFAGCVTALLAPLGLLLLIFPAAPGWLTGEALAHPDAETAIRLVGLQLLVEGVAGFGSSALKIVVSPGASLPHLMAVMYGFAVPAVVVLSLAGRLSLVSLWAVMLSARLVFVGCVLWVHRGWRARAGGVAVPGG
ncbi:hypothetical protein, partial [Streptomyces calidiresistens]|uniref:hypothetical protein n=1 Tax=Streptomyces calidiresistens TaxID=1485586 RepID=UPI001E5C47E3